MAKDTDIKTTGNSWNNNSPRWLQVIEAFRDYRRGDKITNPEEIKEALESYAAHVRPL